MGRSHIKYLPVLGYDLAQHVINYSYQASGFLVDNGFDAGSVIVRTVIALFVEILGYRTIGVQGVKLLNSEEIHSAFGR